MGQSYKSYQVRPRETCTLLRHVLTGSTRKFNNALKVCKAFNIKLKG